MIMYSWDIMFPKRSIRLDFLLHSPHRFKRGEHKTTWITKSYSLSLAHHMSAHVQAWVSVGAWASLWEYSCVCKVDRDTKRTQMHAQTQSLHIKANKSACTHGPCGRLGGAGLLEGHLEVVRPGVVGVGGDSRGRRQALKSGVGLGVGRRGGHGRRRGVLRAVGAGGRRTAPQALHAAAQQVVLGLGRNEEGRAWSRQRGREQEGRRRTQVEVLRRQGLEGFKKVRLQWEGSKFL